MKYNIYAIGNMKTSPEAEIFWKYSKRIKSIELFEFVSKFSEENKKKEDESEKLLSMIKNNGKKILLDQNGQNLDSYEFSSLLLNLANDGCNKVNFIIGGSNGVSNELKKNVDMMLSFSKMTFPHILARIILLEQIYRAETIILKHPYHKN